MRIQVVPEYKVARWVNTLGHGSGTHEAQGVRMQENIMP
jgi:hypothetical protein